MNVFRVHLKDGKEILVMAERFEHNKSNHTIRFFKSKDEEDKDVFVDYNNVVAIVPALDLSGDRPRRILAA